MALPTDSENAAFHAMCQVTQQLAEKLEQYEARNLHDSFDDEESIKNPIYESVLNSNRLNRIYK